MNLTLTFCYYTYFLFPTKNPTYTDIYCASYYDTLNRDKGYNLKSGGQDHNSYSTESRRKMSESVKKSYLNSNLKSIRSSDAINQWKNPKIKEKITGKNNGMYGRHHTEEAIPLGRMVIDFMI